MQKIKDAGRLINRNKIKLKPKVKLGLKFKLIITFVISSFAILASAKISDTKIQELQNKISSENSKLSKVEVDIKQIDEKISNETKTLSQVNQDLFKLNTKKSQLEQERTIKLQSLEQHKSQLIKQLEAMYLITNKSNLSKISNLQNVEQFQRYITYLQAYNNYNNDNIKQIKINLENLNKLEADLTSLAEKQNEYKSSITKSHTELKKLKSDNMVLKKNLISSLESKRASLEYFQNMSKKLNKILDTVENSSHKSAHEDTSIPDSPNALFAKARGKLPLPIAGALSVKQKDSMKNTVFIEAEEGTPVKAVYSGTVIFSNWLRGFGFLAIIDHGDNYMSLYGNNQALLKPVGSFVEAGETIAISGASGGIASSGLYFEIRHKGTAVNTVAWLRNDSKSTIG